MEMERQVIGLDVKPGVGQRVIMANTRDRWRGEGAISSVHASGSYCGVQWDSGHLDVCLFTGMQNEYHLLAATCVGSDGSGHRLPFDQATPKAALPEGYDLWLPKEDTELQETFNTYGHRLQHVRPSDAHDHYHSACLPCERLRAESSYAPATRRDQGLESATFSALESYTTSSLLYEDEDGSDLQKLILAQEVVKLRAEVARLEAQKVHDQADEGAVAAVRDEILILQARKAQTIEQREIDKKLLQLEIQKLLQEAALISGVQQSVDPKASGWKDRVQHAHDLQANELDALHLLVDQAASEHEFVQAVRAIRREVKCSSIRHLAASSCQKQSVKDLVQMSNQRLQSAIADATELPVRCDVELEALRILIENAQLRQAINRYAKEFLAIATAKKQLRQGSEWHTSLSLGERSVGWRESHHDYHVMRFRDTNTDSRQTKVPAATEREEGHARRWFDLPQYNVDLPQYNVDKMQADRWEAEETNMQRARRGLLPSSAGAVAQEVVRRHREHEERLWWAEENRASVEGAALLAATQALASQALVRRVSSLSPVDVRWELKEAERVEQARRQAEKQEIDRLARELQREMAHNMADIGTAVAAVSVRQGDEGLDGRCVGGAGLVESAADACNDACNDDTMTPPSETEETALEAHAPAAQPSLLHDADHLLSRHLAVANGSVPSARRRPVTD